MQRIDFGVLSVVRQSLIRGTVGASCGLTEADLYTTMPRTLERGEALVLDIEEAWHFLPEDASEDGDSQRAATNSLAGKIVFRLIVLSDSTNGSEALDIANQARFLLDGATLSLDKEKDGSEDQQLEATFRMVSNVVDLKKRRDLPRKVEQLYEALIHKKPVTKSASFLKPSESYDSLPVSLLPSPAEGKAKSARKSARSPRHLFGKAKK